MNLLGLPVLIATPNHTSGYGFQLVEFTTRRGEPKEPRSEELIRLAREDSREETANTSY
jgi:hypothetical protein